MTLSETTHHDKDATRLTSELVKVQNPDGSRYDDVALELAKSYVEHGHAWVKWNDTIRIYEFSQSSRKAHNQIKER